MAISSVIARFLAEEHKYTPLPPEIHLLGRQTITPTLEETISILEDTGIPQPTRPIHVEFDKATREAKDRPGTISDTTFFSLFGVQRLRAFDHSSFEGADLVLDLTEPLPTAYESCADFIFDGSVMDNVFDPATALHNVARLLKPGGRYVGVNTGTTRWLPSYITFNPYWFFDFFVVNGFKDVKVYLLDYQDTFHPQACWHDISVYALDPSAQHQNVHAFPVGSGLVLLLVIAEKDGASTWNQKISQGVYRLEQEWKSFNPNVLKIAESPRPFFRFARRSEILGGPPGFPYLGDLNHLGLLQRNPLHAPPAVERFELDFARPFPGGSGWGDVGQHDGISWRWMDDYSKGGTYILVNLSPHREFTLRAIIHTAFNIQCISALRVRCNGTLLPKQEVIWADHVSPQLVALIPAELISSEGPSRISFSIESDQRDPLRGQSVAFSALCIE